MNKYLENMSIVLETRTRAYKVMWVPPEPEIDFEACWVADAECGNVGSWNAPCGATAAQALANADSHLTAIINGSQQ